MSNTRHANQEQEIELAFLAKSLPKELQTIEPERIIDIYLSDDSDLLTKLRLRQKDDYYELTKKINTDPNDLSFQDEYTIPLSSHEFEKFCALGGREVIKDRYVIKHGHHDIEIDVFKGKLEGFVLIECEFKNLADRNAFVPPNYCGPEVTQEDFIAGVYLAGKRYADIEQELKRLDYKRL